MEHVLSSHGVERTSAMEERAVGVKKFEVEFVRTSYIIVTVEATSEEDAEEKAWEKLDDTYEHNNLEDADWGVESIEEIKEWRE